VSGGVNFSFLSKEVTANKVVGYRNIIIMDLDLLFFVVIFLLASKSFTEPNKPTFCSYTSLGQGYKSKSCANPRSPNRFSSV
jgi:hypothetical protein